MRQKNMMIPTNKCSHFPLDSRIVRQFFSLEEKKKYDESTCLVEFLLTASDEEISAMHEDNVYFNNHMLLQVYLLRLENESRLLEVAVERFHGKSFPNNISNRQLKKYLMGCAFINIQNFLKKIALGKNR